MATRTHKTKTVQKLNPKRALVYIRISPGERKSSRTGKNEDAAGREVQIRDCASWAATNGVTIVAEPFEDINICGETDNLDSSLSDRPGLLNAIASMRELDAGILLVQKGDRLARDTMLAPMARRLVQREGGEVVNANGLGNGDSPEAMIVRTIDDMLNALELIRIRQRTRAALAVKQLRGERTGGIPFGYRLATDGHHRTLHDPEAKHDPRCKGCLHVIPDPNEQSVLITIYDLDDRGLSIPGIIRHLNDSDYAHRGARWHYETIKRILMKKSS